MVGIITNNHCHLVDFVHAKVYAIRRRGNAPCHHQHSSRVWALRATGMLYLSIKTMLSKSESMYGDGKFQFILHVGRYSRRRQFLSNCPRQQLHRQNGRNPSIFWILHGALVLWYVDSPLISSGSGRGVRAPRLELPILRCFLSVKIAFILATNWLSSKATRFRQGILCPIISNVSPCLVRCVIKVGC